MRFWPDFKIERKIRTIFSGWLHHETGADAPRARTHALHRPIRAHMPHLLEVGVPDSLGLIVGVADIISHGWSFPAEFTNSAHYSDPFINIYTPGRFAPVKRFYLTESPPDSKPIWHNTAKNSSAPERNATAPSFPRSSVGMKIEYPADEHASALCSKVPCTGGKTAKGLSVNKPLRDRAGF